jgi:hypothetical protein
VRLWTELVRLHGWLSLRRVFLAAFALVVLAMLGGATPLAKAEDVPGGTLFIRFSYDTLPIAPGVLCQGSQYKILVQPGQVIGQVRKHIHAGIEVDALLNKASPRFLELREHDPAGIISYDAQNVGKEVLAFNAYQKIRLTGDENVLPQIAKKSFEFEVQECIYSVIFVYSWQMATGGASFVQVGYMAKTKLTRKDDGTFEGKGPFELTQSATLPECATSLSDITFPTNINGNMLQDSRELQLNFKYEKAAMTAVVSCDGKTASKSVTMDASLGGVNSAKFPEEGGSKVFSIPGPLKDGKMTIIVNREVVNIAR